MQMLEGLDDNTDLAHLAEDIPESSDCSKVTTRRRLSADQRAC